MKPSDFVWIFAILGILRVLWHLRNNSFQTSGMLRALINTVVVVAVFIYLLSSVEKCNSGKNGRSTTSLRVLVEDEYQTGKDVSLILDEFNSMEELKEDAFNDIDFLVEPRIVKLNKEQKNRANELFRVTYDIVKNQRTGLYPKLEDLLKENKVPPDILASIAEELQQDMRLAIDNESPFTSSQYYPVYFLCAEIAEGTKYDLVDNTPNEWSKANLVEDNPDDFEWTVKSDQKDNLRPPIRGPRRAANSRSYLNRAKDSIRTQQYEYAAFGAEAILNSLTEDSLTFLSELHDIYLVQAYALHRMGKWQEAISAYNSAMAISLDMDSIFYIQHRANVYRDSGAYDKARDDYMKIIEQDTGFAHQYVDMMGVYFGLGRVFEYLEDDSAAIVNYDKALSLADQGRDLCNVGNEDDHRVDPLACAFVSLDDFKNMFRDSTEMREQLKSGMPDSLKRGPVLKVDFTRREVLKEGLLRQRGQPRPIKSFEERKKERLAEINWARRKAHEEKRRAWLVGAEEDIRIEKEKIVQDRIFLPESAVTKAYYRRGRLYLKQTPVNKAGAAQDFIQLMSICKGDYQSGVCAEFAALLGEEKFTAIKDTIVAPDTMAMIMVAALESVRVDMEEDKKHSGSRQWQIWGLGLLALVVLGMMFFVWRRRKSA